MQAAEGLPACFIQKMEDGRFRGFPGKKSCNL